MFSRGYLYPTLFSKFKYTTLSFAYQNNKIHFFGSQKNHILFLAKLCSKRRYYFSLMFSQCCKVMFAKNILFFRGNTYIFICNLYARVCVYMCMWTYMYWQHYCTTSFVQTRIFLPLESILIQYLTNMILRMYLIEKNTMKDKPSLLC